VRAHSNSCWAARATAAARERIAPSRWRASPAAEQALWGGDHYLLKPFDLEDLLRTIQALIGSA